MTEKRKNIFNGCRPLMGIKKIGEIEKKLKRNNKNRKKKKRTQKK